MQMVVVGEQLLGARHVAGRAFQVDAVGAQIDVDVQAVFEHVQVFIAGAEQGFEVRADLNTFLHSELLRRLLQLGAPTWMCVTDLRYIKVAGFCTQRIFSEVEPTGTRANRARMDII